MQISQGLVCLLTLVYHSFMKKLISSYDRGFVRVLVARLQDEAVKHMVKDESASSMGEVTPIVASQHVWIMDAQDVAKAEAILENLQEATVTTLSGWTCPACNEEIEPQFTECWQCGAERPPEA